MRLFGLIGFPLTHSFSEQYFTEKFRREGIKDAMYRKFPITDISLLPDLIKCHPDLKGFNVTIPYKEQIIPLLDGLDDSAKIVRAVNTVVCLEIKAKPYLLGCNTDIVGFRNSIKPFLASHHERALILGTGGAAKAVAHVLRDQIGVAVVFVSREKTTIDGWTVISYEQLNKEVIDAYKLIVNCTPVGTFPDVNAAPSIPYEFITQEHFLYDVVYNPAETLFLRKGKEKGALVLNGMDMLKLQAEEAWKLWNSPWG